ncbi:MAG: hypothetical protein GX307_00805 [Euryarchaeota archaeon]|nr:hypothetical protein [Euryarchaeota archaeon]
MSDSKWIGIILLSAGAISIIGSILNASPGPDPHLPSDVALRLGLVIGLSLGGAVLLSLGATFLLCSKAPTVEDHES